MTNIVAVLYKAAISSASNVKKKTIDQYIYIVATDRLEPKIMG